MQSQNGAASQSNLPIGPVCTALDLAVVALSIVCAVTVFLPHPAQGETTPATLDVHVRSYPEPGKVLVSVDVPKIPSAAKGTILKLAVHLREATPRRTTTRQSAASTSKPLCSILQDTTRSIRQEVVLDAANLPPGEYPVSVELLLPNGTRMKNETQTVRWPGRSEAFKNVRILNNLVWQLLSVKAAPGRPLEGKHTIRLPYDRWVFVRSTASQSGGNVSVKLRTAGGDVLLTDHGPDQPQTAEAMRLVKSGEHTLVVAVEGKATLDQLDVRAVPQIQYSRHPSSTKPIKQGVSYDWEFLRRHILPQVNTIVISKPGKDAEPAIHQWKERGGRVITYETRPGLHGKSNLEANGEVWREYWAKQPGYVDPLSDGVLIDEFYRDEEPVYPVYTAAVKVLNGRFPNKAFYPYVAGKFGKDRGSVPFAEVCLAGGGYVCWEAYLAEWPTLGQALNEMRRYPHVHFIPFEEKVPGLIRRTIWVSGAYSFPWPWADGYANVNYNAYLDMQFEFIATHPALFGLGGVDIWRSGYCDEERLRWIGRFYRHYCIEGHTKALGTDPYLLEHIRNGDFTEGVKNWQLEPAVAGAISAGSEKGFGKFIQRYSRGPDTFLATTRHSDKPNTIRQTICGMEAGKLYSVKMLTGDYGAFLKGKSEKSLHAVLLDISGAERLSGPRYSYQQAFPTKNAQGRFTPEKPFWLNYHWQVFRATYTTAILCVSDWKSPQDPGGPVGQQMLYTFIEVKPYLDSNDRTP